jgi:hypothetical protein
MGQLYSISDFGRKFEDRLTLCQQELLERAIAKLVLIGEQVGVSAGQMIVLLESGLTVGELLDYLAIRNNEMEPGSSEIS